MRRIINPMVLLALAPAPAALAAAPEVYHDYAGDAVWHLKQRKVHSIASLLPEPKLAHTWLRGGPGERKDGSDGLDDPSGLPLKQGDGVRVDFSKDSPANEAWIDVTDARQVSKLSIRLTRSLDLSTLEYKTEITFVPALDDETVGKVATCSGNTVKLIDGQWWKAFRL